MYKEKIVACSIEMLPCDNCGREVERYNIYVIKNDEGERLWVCPDCAGKTEESKEETSIVSCD